MIDRGVEEVVLLEIQDIRFRNGIERRQQTVTPRNLLAGPCWSMIQTTNGKSRVLVVSLFYVQIQRKPAVGPVRLQEAKKWEPAVLKAIRTVHEYRHLDGIARHGNTRGYREGVAHRCAAANRLRQSTGESSAPFRAVATGCQCP